jgi:hypothetical protein
LVWAVSAPFSYSKTNTEAYMKILVTIGEVSNRVDAMNQDCHDQLVDVPVISFDSLQTIKIGDERHTLRTLAQRSIAWGLGIPYN